MYSSGFMTVKGAELESVFKQPLIELLCAEEVPECDVAGS